MALTAKQRRFLRAEAHHLKPVVLMGQNGLTDAVLAEIEQALLIHELIKVRIPGVEREEKKPIIEAICTHCDCAHVQTVGHIATLYRPHPEKPQLVVPRAG